MKFRFLIIIFIVAAGIISSCETKPDMKPKSDFLAYPAIAVKDFRTILSDSGKIELIMTSPIMEKFDIVTEPYTEFREGIKVDFYDGNEIPSGSVTAKYAKYTKNNDLWELRDSVVVINENKQKLETELLNWSQSKDLIYTDKFVKITSAEEIIMGFGFESDSHLKRRKIWKVSATIYVDDEE